MAPPRQQNATSFFYFATDQHRYEETDPATLASPLGGHLARLTPAEANALAVRLGWLPCFPQYDENPLDSAERARAAGATNDREIADHVARRLVAGDLTWSIEAPDRPVNHPRVLFVWRANLLGASGKGHEFFLSHLLGADGHPLADPAGEAAAPRGKLDLLVDIDFRMTSSGLYADVVLPAATWYEKTDLSSTDMHPFVHPFNPAISPPWEARSDWETFTALARVFSRLAETHLGVVDDVVLTPLMHDTPDELAQTRGRVRDWRAGEVEAVPGRTMPHVSVVRRDYPAVHARMTALGPRARERIAAKGIAIDGAEAYEELARLLGRRSGGGVDGCPVLERDRDVAEAILRLSGTTNGRRAVAQWRSLERPTGLALTHVAEGHADTAYSLADLTAQPRPALATPVWSGLEAPDRRYAPYTANVELAIPWRTLTGRQHVYLDHELLADFGESLPVYRPPLALGPFAPGDRLAPPADARTVTVRYLTPHGKWAIHSMYAEDAPMLTLFRGGPTVWVSVEDARAMGIADNAWIEVFNRNGAIAARAVVSHRIPAGVAFMYHAGDRTVGVPATRVTGDRGGTHNSVVRVAPKPTHMIGGYAQLSYAFNYYGPTGHQRDSVAYIRPLEEVRWLED
jgi:nitrate reductase alpha subunit